MNSIDHLRQVIEDELKAIDVPASPTNLYDPIRYIISLGGKRVRPILTLMGASLMLGDWRSAMPQAMAIEIFHNFTLVHDDIMDSAEVRRGLPTVHKKWDDNIGILSGDGMLVVAYQYLMRAPQDRLAKLSKVFSSTALEVCEGQQLDMDYAQKASVPMDDYLYMIRRKTAVLLGGAMQLGAIVAGAPDEELEKMQSFAEDMGLAFQIRDDYLDSFGDQESFGKEIGGDIREGKRTWLTIKAYELADSEQNAKLTKAYASDDIESRIKQVLEVYGELDIAQHAQDAIELYSTRSAESLAAIHGDDEVKDQLRGLISYLIGRNS